MVGYVLAQPARQRLDRHQVGPVAGSGISSCSASPPRPAPRRPGGMMRRPQHDQRPVRCSSRRRSTSMVCAPSRAGRATAAPALRCRGRGRERDLGRETGRAGGDPQPLAACGRAIAEVGTGWMWASSRYTRRCWSRWAAASTLCSSSTNACRRTGSARPSSFLAFFQLRSRRCRAAGPSRAADSGRAAHAPRRRGA